MIQFISRQSIGPALWLSIFFSTLIWSALAPADRFTWTLEVLPAVVGLIILAVTYRRFSLTSLVYWLILAHCLVLMVGGHYTYAEVPLFESLKPLLGWERNNFDKLGHFMQGLVPAMIARELLIRHAVVSTAPWRNTFIISFCLAFSAFYELIEWQVAVATGDSAEAFLGTQGFVWDTQTDMAMALLGAITALCLLSRVHDKQLESKMLHRS